MRKPLRTQTTEFITAMLFISPWIVGILAFTIYPIVMSFYYSLTEYKVMQAPTFIGFANYVNLFKDKLFVTSLVNTLYIVLIGVPLTILCALLVSILMNNKKLKGMSFFRVVFFIPTLVPLFINCILWLWLLQPDTGLINTIIGFFGIKGPRWIADPIWSKPALILMMIWGCGGSIIIFLAGLQDISEELYESASLDGANFFQRTFSITLPLLAPVILYNTVTMVINAFQWFAEPFIMTEGGPNSSTLFYSLYLYQNAFQFFKMGLASAMGWILLLIALLIIWVLFKGLDQAAE
jgi:multiple sugar transport system permease protein